MTDERLSVHDVLMLARVELSARGAWIQSDYHDGGRHCLVGAVEYVARANKVPVSLVSNAVAHLARLVPPRIARMIGTPVGLALPIDIVVAFNDTRRRKSQVLELLDRAIAATAAAEVRDRKIELVGA